MISKPYNSNLSLSNSAMVEAINSVTGLFQELSLADGEKKKRYRYCAYGEYPQKVPGKGPIIQVVDKAAAEEMVANFRSFAGLDTFFKGIPVYEGHPDDASWLQANPGHKAKAVARIKTIEAGEDGIYVEEVFNADGVRLLSGEAPQYSGHSPRWNCQPIEGRPGYYRPVLLLSDGLTNNPNIPGSTLALNTSPKAPAPGAEPEKPTKNMKLTPAALKALGFAPDAEPTAAEISAAICKACSDGDCAATDCATAKNDLTAANTTITELRSTVTALSKSAIDAAVADGRITEADRERWTTAINTSPSTELDKLSKLMPVLNTENKLPHMGQRREVLGAHGNIDAMNAAVADYAREKGLDLSNPAQHSQAWTGAKAAKPEIFQR